MLIGVAYLYHITDCHGKFRGVSDVCLILACLCFFVAFFMTFIAGAMAASAASSEYATLNTSVRDSQDRSDANILVLEVSEERMRRFLDEEQNQHVQLTVTRDHSCCMQCCRVWSYLYLIVLLAVLAFCGGLHYLVDSRYMCFYLGYLAFLFVVAAWAKTRRTQSALDHAKKRELQQWGQELRGPQQLTLFHNQSDPTGGNPSSMEYKSMIALGKRRCSFFSPAAPNVPGAATRTTYTRIVDDTIELRAVVRTQSPGLLRAEVRVESTTRLPIDLNNVAQVRGWLSLHRDIFEFETATDVELAHGA